MDLTATDPALEMTELRRQRDAAAAQAAALEDVLRAITASPDNPQPVFDLIAGRARELCQAASVALTEHDGTLLHLRAFQSADPLSTAIARQAFPRAPTADNMMGRALLGNASVHERDRDPGADASLPGLRSGLCVPLRSDGRPIGVIALGRTEPGGFDAAQVALVESFAEQASLAMTGAATLRDMRQRSADLKEAQEQQAATAEMLQVINASPGDLARVFAAMLEKAMALIGAAFGILYRYDGSASEPLAHRGVPPALAQHYADHPIVPRGPLLRTLQEGRPSQLSDITEIPLFKQGDPSVRAIVELGGARTVLNVPLTKDDTAIGYITFYRQEVRAFSPRQVALVENFAAQAVIAMENARLLTELQARSDDLQETLEQQTAAAEVLGAINASAGNLAPVFDALVEKSMRLCKAAFGILMIYDGDRFTTVTTMGLPPAFEAYRKTATPTVSGPGSPFGRALASKRSVHVPDWTQEEIYRTGGPGGRALADLGGARTALFVPLVQDGAVKGMLSICRQEAKAFSPKQVALVETFAEQAVIAISSAATLTALQERTAELTRSVSDLNALEEALRAVNASLDLDTVLETVAGRAAALARADEGMVYGYDADQACFVPLSASGMAPERVALLRDRRIRIGETYLGRAAALRAPVNIEDLRADSESRGEAEALPDIRAVLAIPLVGKDGLVGGLVVRRRQGGGFGRSAVTLMQTFAGQCVLAIENARLFQQLAARGEEARRARMTAEDALEDLRKAQDRLVQSEKLASLGQLTAGIAHEIKNPLNFVNNFSDLSGELLEELLELVGSGAPDAAEVADLASMLRGNLEKIAHHGKRADSIVKNMLLHSRTGPGESRPIDVNATVEEALNLAYHGARAENRDFNITLEKDLDPGAGQVEAFPQELTRVLLNLFGNGFYAARKRSAKAPGHAPVLRVSTSALPGAVCIRVRDNGTGIPEQARDKIFEPFFTTKPAGEGTGLGLSLSYDIVVKQHGGQLSVDSRVDDFTEFAVTLPRRLSEGPPA